MDNEVLQANQTHYIMLNKPIGVVCATKDEKHKTVIDLLAGQYEQEILDNLHIVGRLDLNTSGLVLLTNDSRWSERLTSPEHKVSKCYRVTLENALTLDYVDAFAKGMYFPYEKITTKPATLLIVSQFEAQVTLTEGRYHQIKRMFGRFRNPVIALHRDSIGKVHLDESLKAGGSRALNISEVTSINS
jgi:16S rRNA pseudouridine516 synthase